MMNEKAAALGMTGTHFANPNGLPDENHYTTAGDMALIMSECIKNDTFRKIVSTTEYTVPATNKTAKERIYQNHDKLIIKDSGFYYDACIGGKTGYTDAALRTLVAAAEKDGKTLVGVTMYAPTNQDFKDMVSLFEYGFTNFSAADVTVTADGTKTEGTATLPSGITADKLTAQKSTDSTGASVYTYYYEKLPVGTGKEVSVTPTPTPAVSAADSVPSGNAGQGNSPLRIILIILCVLTALGILMIIISAVRNARRRARRRKRRK